MVHLADQYDEAHKTTEVGNQEDRKLAQKLCFICRGNHLARNCPTSGPNANGSPGKGGGKYVSSQRPPLSNRNSSFRSNQGRREMGHACTRGRNWRRGHVPPRREEMNVSTDVEDALLYMPVCQGYVKGKKVTVLRDTGCSSVVVRAALVSKEEYTGGTRKCLLMDGTPKFCPIALITISTPYIEGKVEAMVMDNPVYDLIIGNVQGVKDLDVMKEDKGAEAENATAKGSVAEETFEQTHVGLGVQTRAQKKKEGKPTKPLNVRTSLVDISKQDIGKEQGEDSTLESLRSQVGRGEKRTYENGGEAWFEKKGGIIYRFYRKADTIGGIVRQLVVPEMYRKHVLRIGHDNLMSGHLGIKKTADRILAEFYWPGGMRRYKKILPIMRGMPKYVSQGESATATNRRNAND